MQNIDQILKERIQEKLAPAEIVEVFSEEAEDHDGDPILNIRVVFKAKNDRLDPEKVVGLVQHLQPTLRKLQMDRFPIPSFMTPEEVEFATARLLVNEDS